MPYYFFKDVEVNRREAHTLLNDNKTVTVLQDDGRTCNVHYGGIGGKTEYFVLDNGDEAMAHPGNAGSALNVACWWPTP